MPGMVACAVIPAHAFYQGGVSRRMVADASPGKKMRQDPI
jgi:hypothetical protein